MLLVGFGNLMRRMLGENSFRLMGIKSSVASSVVDHTPGIDQIGMSDL